MCLMCPEKKMDDENEITPLQNDDDIEFSYFDSDDFDDDSDDDFGLPVIEW